MLKNSRRQFNASFTQEKYNQYLAYFEKLYPAALHFTLAETPIFIPNSFKQQLIEAGEYITSQIVDPQFKSMTNDAIPKDYFVPNEPDRPLCMVIDFAIAENKDGQLVPKLIELQGFPSLFAFEILQENALRSAYQISKNYTAYLNGYTERKYLTHFKKILKPTRKGHTILLEILPHQQKTRIDFYATQSFFGIPIVCITEIYVKGDLLFYKREGKEYNITKIYNRVIVDELKNQSNLIQEKGKLLQLPLKLEWVNHPHHYFRISKYLMPSLSHSCIAPSQFLSKLTKIPKELENYVLKPLFSFAGQGVVMDVTLQAIEKIKDPENWILQEKINYSEIIKTPTIKSKAEIRLFYFWDELTKTYIATLNLTRLSKGKMIGVDYNKNDTWVGGSLAFFKK